MLTITPVSRLFSYASPHVHLYCCDRDLETRAGGSRHPEKASSFHRETRIIIYMVAEEFRLVVGERISERICEPIADVHVPQVVEQIIEVTKMAEQILDVLVLETVEQSVKLPSTISEDRIQERTAQRIVDIPVPQDVEELVEVPTVSQDRIQQRFAEQTIDSLGISLAEKIVEGLVTQTQGNTQQVVNTDVQHVVNTVEAEVPLSQFIDKAVEIPVVAQRQISIVQTVRRV